jgi:hypothetical protein
VSNKKVSPKPPLAGVVIDSSIFGPTTGPTWSWRCGSACLWPRWTTS